MKRLIFWTWVVAMLLVSCSSGPSAEERASTATAQVIRNDIATVVAGTQTAIAIQSTPAPSRTPGVLPLSKAILTSRELNELYDNWPSQTLASDAIDGEEVCLEKCIVRYWQSADRGSQLAIVLSLFPNNDGAATYFRELQEGAASSGEVLILPEIVALPDDSIVADVTGGGPGYLLVSRQRAVVVWIAGIMPHLNIDQNVLFLSLYGERQIQKLDESGY